MDALGIPTTRALAMVASDAPVERERVETAAIVVRLAPSFVRFGSFEIFAARNEPEPMRALADYTIERFYPECGRGDDRYERFFAAVIERTARLMADWQSVGFMHGVMNTDNFSILGLTLDYGPYGFMEALRSRPHLQPQRRARPLRVRPAALHRLWNAYALANALAGIIEPARLERRSRATSRCIRDVLGAHARQARLALAETGRRAIGKTSHLMAAAGPTSPARSAPWPTPVPTSSYPRRDRGRGRLARAYDAPGGAIRMAPAGPAGGDERGHPPHRPATITSPRRRSPRPSRRRRPGSPAPRRPAHPIRRLRRRRRLRPAGTKQPPAR